MARGFFNPRAAFAMELIAAVRDARLAMGDPVKREEAVNCLVSIAAAWTRDDDEYRREMAEIEAGVQAGRVREKEGRYMVLAAVVAALKRQGVFDTVETPIDREAWDEDEAGEGVDGVA